MRNLFAFVALFVLVITLSGCGAAAQPSPTPEPTDAPTLEPTTAPAVGDAERGHQIFTKGLNESPPCTSCHMAADVNFGFSLGPNLVGIAQRAATRVEGLDAAAYIHQSILDPHSYVVAGYRDIMYPDYSKYFDEQDLTDLMAFLMTL